MVDHGPATVARVARTRGLPRQAVQQTANALTDDERAQLAAALARAEELDRAG